MTLEFLYDFGSPNAYLVHKVLPNLAARCDVPVHYVPVLLGGIFKATNNQSPMQAFGSVKGKLSYQSRELTRFVARHAIPFKMNPNFPVMTIGVMRGATYAQGKEWEKTYIDTVFDAMWLHEKKMDDPEVISAVLTAAGLPTAEIMAATQSPEVKQGLIDNTAAAVERGTFGSPTVFAGEEMFFGKDSLPDLEWHLTQASA